MAIKIGSLLVELGLDSSTFKSGLDVSQRELRKAERSIAQTGKQLKGLGQTLSLAVTVPMIALGKKAVDGFVDQQKAVAQVEAALKSMGNVSGKTSAELQKTADALEMRSLVDADVILTDVTANLLTFGNVAGKQFDRAQRAALDMAQRLKTGPKDAAIQLGKALNDPIKGITSLTRSGIQFTDQQKAQIRAMTEMGNVAGAQGIILAEVEKQFKGAAAAAADASPWRKAQVAIEQAMDGIGAAILPAIKPVAEAIKSMAEAFSSLSPTMQKAIVVTAGLAAVFGPLLMVIGSAVTAMAPFLAVLKAAAASGGVLLAAKGAVAGLTAAFGPLLVPMAAMAAAGVLIYQNWHNIAPVLRDVAVGLGLMKSEVQNAASGLQEQFAGVRDVVMQSGLTTKQEAEKIREALQKMSARGAIDQAVLLEIEGLVFQIENAGKISAEEAEKIRANLRTAWEADRRGKSGWQQLGEEIRYVGQIAGEAWSAFTTKLGNRLNLYYQIAKTTFSSIYGFAKEGTEKTIAVIKQLGPAAVESVRNLYIGVKTWLQDKLGAVFKSVTDKVAVVQNSFFKLYDAVVGHSYIPDMVEGIADEMKRLDTVMVDKAQVATRKTGDAFRALAGEVQSIMAEAFPEAARLLALRDKLSTLDEGVRAGVIDADTGNAARMRLLRQNNGTDGTDGIRVTALSASELMEPLTRLKDAGGEVRKAMEDMSRTAKVQTVQVAQSFKDMAQATTASIQNMANAIKGGGFLDILSAALNLFSQLGSIGVFGKNIAKNINAPRIPGYANGTNFHPGGFAMVGERGPELLNLPRGSKVIPNNKMGGGNSYTFQGNLLTPEFWAQIQAGDVAAARGGAQIAHSQSAFRQSRRVG